MPEVKLTNQDVAKCLRFALPNSIGDDFEILEVLSGTINDVYRIGVGRREYALRVRVREQFFGYEKNLIKDVVVARMLTAMSGSTSASKNELEFDGIIADTISRGCGGPVPSPISPALIGYDHRRVLIPYLWTLQTWAQGKNPKKEDLNDYAAIGASLALLHALKFSNFKTTLEVPWTRADQWAARFNDEIKEKARFLEIEVPGVGTLLGDSEIKQFCLNHNDLQPMNVLIDEKGAATFIDWDNLQVAPAEFDLVKLKYWTVTTDDYFGHSSNEYNAFLNSYFEKSGHSYDERIFTFCELVWLLRVAHFEKRRAASGQEIPKPFPSVPYYLSAIKELKERVGR